MHWITWLCHHMFPLSLSPRILLPQKGENLRELDFILLHQCDTVSTITSPVYQCNSAHQWKYKLIATIPVPPFVHKKSVPLLNTLHYCVSQQFYKWKYEYIAKDNPPLIVTISSSKTCSSPCLRSLALCASCAMAHDINSLSKICSSPCRLCARYPCSGAVNPAASHQGIWHNPCTLCNLCNGT